VPLREKLVWGPVDVDGRVIETSLTPAETNVLRECARGKDVLEVGAGYGYSAIIMGQVAEHVTSVDPHAGELPQSEAVMRAHLAHFKLEDKVKIVRNYSERVWPRWLASFEFIFIDGNHDYQVRGDVQNAIRLLEPGGWMAVHDYGQYDFPKIIEACDEVCTPPQRLVDTLWLWQCPASLS
jgi:predicted O-methyltransferase YrrM